VRCGGVGAQGPHPAELALQYGGPKGAAVFLAAGMPTYFLTYKLTCASVRSVSSRLGAVFVASPGFDVQLCAALVAGPAFALATKAVSSALAAVTLGAVSLPASTTCALVALTSWALHRLTLPFRAPYQLALARRFSHAE
jgi:hypothetical protein